MNVIREMLPEHTKMHRYLLGIIFMIAFLPRLMIAIHAPAKLTGDEVAYDKYAKSIVANKGFSDNGKPTSFRPPFYIFFLSAVYYLFGPNYMMIKIIQSLVGAFTCIVIYYLAREAFSKEVGIISGLLSASYPSFIYVSSRILAETIFIFFFTVAIFYLFKIRSSPSGTDCIILGLSLGIAALTKAAVQLFPLVILACLVFYRKTNKIFPKEALRSFTIISISFLLPIIPWAIRNYYVHRAIVTITTETGEAFYSSYFPRDGKIFGFSPDDKNIEQWRAISSEAEGSLFLMRKTFKFIKNNPQQVFLKLLPLKIIYFWSIFDWEVIGNGIYNFMYVFILPFAMAAIFLYLRDWRQHLPFYLTIVYCFGMAIVFYGSPRFRLFIDPCLVIFAAAGIFRLFEFFPRKIAPFLIIFGYLFVDMVIFFYSSAIKEVVKNLLKGWGLW